MRPFLRRTVALAALAQRQADQVLRASSKSTSMLRQATYKDIPVLAQRWYEEKAKTCFNQLDVEWAVEGCATFLMNVLGTSNHCIYVSEQDGHIVAACGAILQRDLLPPHPYVIGEWMWWGLDKRETVKVLHACHAWGKQHGAILARYVLNRPGQSPTKFTETYQWEVLS